MALQTFVAGYLLMLILICKGCHSQQPECGKAFATTRIIGGTNAAPGSWPWQVVFKEAGVFFCGGSLISNQWVLTAGHCFPKLGYNLSSITVHLGVHNLTGFNPHEVVRMVAQVIVHHDYNPNTLDNDICLLKLSAPVNFTEYISPVCLASVGSTFDDGLSTWVTGFGVTDSGSIADILQEVNVPIVGNNACSCYLQDFATITPKMMCAGVLAGGKDSCQGDSGGPLVTLYNDSWIQAGVVSFGDKCALPMRPGVYTRVSDYESWILSIITGMEPGFVPHMSPGFNMDLLFVCPTSLPTTLPTTPETHKPTCDDDSIFGSGENLKPFTQLTTLFVLVPVLHVFVGSGEM